jgi:ankyrin repeat protein
MVQVLLGQGAELNARDRDGWLSLHYAAHAGFLDTVKLLVDSGAPTTSETTEGHIPLWYCILFICSNIV